MNQIAQILLPLPFDKNFDYLIPENIEINIGEYVFVPFGKRNLWGIVTNITDIKNNNFKLKEIISTSKYENIDIPLFPNNLLKLINWQSFYTLENKGKILNLCYNQKFFKIPKRNIKKNQPNSDISTKKMVTLTDDQRKSVDDIKNIINKNHFSVHLLDGVTGSGKTEIYFEIIENNLKQGKQSLILFPEILLTAQMIQRFTNRFGESPILWHSGITEAQRRNNFLAIARGEIKIIIGARSALHLPFHDLGLIVIDEEHDTSYKQDDGVIYNARDIAIARANIEEIPILLCSATPSIESYYNAKIGKYYYHKLATKFSGNNPPEVKIIDMRTEKLPASQFISEQLLHEIKNNLAKQQQSLLFLNRKGYAPLILCGNCGFRFKSPDTSAWMVLHYDNLRNPYLECHHSGNRMKLPEKCPECESKDSFRACGPGVQRIAEEIKLHIPEARTKIISRDIISDSKKSKEVINEIQNGEIDIIIGTQIIAKGYHFPELKLVGVIDGDLGLDFSDLRAAEKCFQLLQQVSGRAGREGKEGTVIIQSYQPEHEVFQHLKNDDRDSFLMHEIEERSEAHLPPFSRLTSIITEGKNEKKSAQLAKDITSLISGSQDIEVYGPAKAMYYELRGYFRNRILIKSDKNINIQKFLRQSLENYDLPKDVKLKIDIDPYNFN